MRCRVESPGDQRDSTLGGREGTREDAQALFPADIRGRTTRPYSRPPKQEHRHVEVLLADVEAVLSTDGNEELKHAPPWNRYAHDSGAR